MALGDMIYRLTSGVWAPLSVNAGPSNLPITQATLAIALATVVKVGPPKTLAAGEGYLEVVPGVSARLLYQDGATTRVVGEADVP